MVPVIIYWGSVILLAVWLVWNVLFSIKFLASGERGNLWGFMLLNIFALIFGILVQWAFADNGFMGLCQIVLVEILNGTFTSVNVLFVYS
ncbi:hypothetical protein AYR54_03510 [Loigolactobacillus backii]|uniref:hypothetical protein n=1 Tax=Loigolactobacillus backii TaxID=375175 RepID=UPI0007F0F422|nr:hypothetical protein [Loigolactobacillus backii]ANK64385.1 hypothetical protein AYR54_03510 [Loigolactobacillus backii]